MSGLNDYTEDEVIANSKPAHLYAHAFGQGRFFQTVHHEQDSITFKIASKTLLKVIYLKEKDDLEGFEIVKIIDGVEKQKVKLSKFNIAQIKVFLSFMTEFDLKGVSEGRLQLEKGSSYSGEALFEKIKELLGDVGVTEKLEGYLSNGFFLAKDLVNTGYRRCQLDVYRSMLEENEFWKKYCDQEGIKQNSEEKAWQHFFEKNQWIFGYGLDYRFNAILQREAQVSSVDLDGSNTVIADYLMGDKMFTTFVELKKPSTPLFENIKNRSGSWRLSDDLIYSVSQILEQKAAGQLKMQTEQYIRGERLAQKSYDSKVILIIGHWNEIDDSKSTQESEIKKKTFELFRRDSRNVDILTYDELFQRAMFIVEGEESEYAKEMTKDRAVEVDEEFDAKKLVVDEDDLPF